MTVTVRTGLELSAQTAEIQRTQMAWGVAAVLFSLSWVGAVHLKSSPVLLSLPRQPVGRFCNPNSLSLSLPLCLKLAIKQDCVFSQSPILCELRQLLPRVTAG